MKEPKRVILGAGLAGLSCAYHLGKGYRLFEKEEEVGGLCRSHRVDGFTFDHSGHLLHFQDKYAKNLVRKLLAGNLSSHRRNSWVYLKGTYIRYPFQANLKGLPSEVVEECVEGFRNAARRNKQRKEHSLDRVNSFHDWILATFGAGMSKHFFIPYNEKFWKFPLREMNHEWMSKLIPQPSMDEVTEGATGEQEKDFGYNRRFAYPKEGGIASLPQAFASRLKDINLLKEAVRISLKKREITFTDRSKTHKRHYDQLISTIPLVELIRIMDDVPASIKEATRELKYTSLLSVNLGVDGKISDKHWIYFPEPEFIFHRVGFPSNFSPHLAPAGKSSLYVEVSYCNSPPEIQKVHAHRHPPPILLAPPLNPPLAPFTKRGREIGAVRIEKGGGNSPKSKHDEIAEQAIKGLVEAGILKSEDQIIVKDVVDTKYAYPILSKDYNERISLIQSFLRENDIFSLGRFGTWQYLTMEQAILHGKLIADEIASHPHLNPPP